jgi:hypothetical protein
MWRKVVDFISSEKERRGLVNVWNRFHDKKKQEVFAEKNSMFLNKLAL